ncbi:Ig-like domain-containing protein [Breznakia pachnodae]|uniref:BIG2 domain-containing protein n=1 Tax=Breznakia pachnodae TaxID=265178 RepID=A0ABU0E2X0_9FIRM|nr:Ig-like domain-containing protein [Breznakia pachnodae]MDQ0361243.1 hypothetical protein [Breznakia pachnodae]
MKKRIQIVIITFITLLSVSGFYYKDTIQADEMMQWDTMIQKLELLETYAEEYCEANNKPLTNVDGLVTNYIRSTRYTGWTWTALAGGVDTEFATYVNNQSAIDNVQVSDLKAINDITTPSGEVIDYTHMFATMATIQKGGNINGDVGGWGGDYSTLAKDVMNATSNSTDYDILYSKASELFRGSSSFGEADWISDLDAYLIMQQRSSGESFATIMDNYYQAVTETSRISAFAQSRIGLDRDSTIEDFRTIVYTLLDNPSNGYLQILHSTNGIATNATLKKATSDAIADYMYSVIGVSEIETTSSVEVGYQDVIALSYTIKPLTAADTTVSFVSNDLSVATVDASGNVYGISAGQTTITITAANGITRTVTVDVIPKYTVTFDYGTLGHDGNEQTTVSTVYLEGDVFVGPQTPMLNDDSYEFDYWLDINSNQKVNGFPLTVDEDSSYQAVYRKREVKTYTVKHYMEQEDGSYKLEEAESKSGYVDSSVNADGNSYAGYTVDYDNTDTQRTGVLESSSELTLALYYKANTDTKYVSKYYLQQEDGTYKLVDEITSAGTTGHTVSASFESYEDYVLDLFHSDTIVSGKINGDESLVLKLYYKMNKPIVDIPKPPVDKEKPIDNSDDKTTDNVVDKSTDSTTAQVGKDAESKPSTSPALVAPGTGDYTDSSMYYGMFILSGSILCLNLFRRKVKQ